MGMGEDKEKLRGCASKPIGDGAIYKNEPNSASALAALDNFQKQTQSEGEETWVTANLRFEPEKES